jgi:hypothetical protein
MSALRAGTVHYGVVQPGVAELEVHPVAPATEHPQNVSAFALIDRPLISRLGERGGLSRGDHCAAGHFATASLLILPP